MLLRLALGGLVIPGALVGDELAYVRYGRTWAETGEYVRHWPPVYPTLVGLCLRVFGSDGLGALRLLQVGSSAWTGWCVWLLASRTVGRRPAVLATWFHALYLPLASLSLAILSETVYVAWLMSVAVGLQRVTSGEWRTWTLAPIGLAAGALALVRDVGLVMWIVLAAALLVAGARRRSSEDSTRLLLAGGAVFGWGLLALTPWALTTAERRGVWRLGGGTAEVNLNVGLSSPYHNFELAPLTGHTEGVGDSLRARLTREPSEPLTPDWIESAADVPERIASSPAFFARSRVVRFADLVTPLNHAIVSWYAPTYDRDCAPSVVRRVITVASLAQVVLLLGAAVWSLRLVRLPSSVAVFAISLTTATITTALLTSQSRFRAPLVPILCVLAAALLKRSPRQSGVVGWPAQAVFASALVAGWIVALPPLLTALEAVW